MLTQEQRDTLLRIAREAMVAAVSGRPYRPEVSDPELKKPGAAFVTLKKHGELRGCIGTVEAHEPLAINVARMARASALEDPRFPPVRPAEAPDLTIEISVMSPPEVADPSKVEVGVHGCIIERGGNRGLLLPQVPVEWGWDREEFLDHTCMKAGLPRGSWRTGECKLYTFAAEVFGEEE
ncbi:MAG: AmmeMemoRadiSam system protein A [Armatimonadota bacterium]